jgi:hypothetical protein
MTRCNDPQEYTRAKLGSLADAFGDLVTLAREVAHLEEVHAEDLPHMPPQVAHALIGRLRRLAAMLEAAHPGDAVEPTPTTHLAPKPMPLTTSTRVRWPPWR